MCLLILSVPAHVDASAALAPSSSFFSLLSSLSLMKRHRRRWASLLLSSSPPPPVPPLDAVGASALTPSSPSTLSTSRVVLPFFWCDLVDFLLPLSLFLSASLALLADLMNTPFPLHFHCCFCSLCPFCPLYFQIWFPLPFLF
jgi:hypothetical protein